MLVDLIVYMIGFVVALKRTDFVARSHGSHPERHTDVLDELLESIAVIDEAFTAPQIFCDVAVKIHSANPSAADSSFQGAPVAFDPLGVGTSDGVHEVDSVVDGEVGVVVDVRQPLVGGPLVRHDCGIRRDVSLDDGQESDGCAVWHNVHPHLPSGPVDEAQDPLTVHTSASIVFHVADLGLVNFDNLTSSTHQPACLVAACQRCVHDLAAIVVPVGDCFRKQDRAVRKIGRFENDLVKLPTLGNAVGHLEDDLHRHVSAREPRAGSHGLREVMWAIAVLQVSPSTMLSAVELLSNAGVHSSPASASVNN